MSHTTGMADSDGTFDKSKAADVSCRKCKAPHVTVREWESSCGGWEDYHYSCAACGHSWWEEGIDS